MNKMLYWFTTGSAVLAFILVVTNLCLINGNQAIQQDIVSKQNEINVAMNVSPINQQLAQALFDASTKAKDNQIRDLLISQGFELKEKADKQPAPAAKEPAAPAKPVKAKTQSVEE